MKNAELRKYLLRLLVVISAFCLLPSALGDLVVTVFPGYTFQPGEVPTVNTLNELGLPTILVTGSIGGTNVAIAAGSITGTMLSPTIVDNVTIGINGSIPPALYVLNGGIFTNNLNSSDFLPPLVGGGASLVKLNFNSSLETNANSQLEVNLTNAPLNNSPAPGDTLLSWSTNANAPRDVPISSLVQTIALRTILVSNLPCATGIILNTNVVNVLAPIVHVVLVVTNAASTGYNVGDELDGSVVLNTAGSPMFGSTANRTNVWVAGNNSAAGATPFIYPKVGGTGGLPATAFSATNFNVKVYITYFAPGN